MGRKPKPAEVRVKFFAARASGATLRQAAAAAGVSRTAGVGWLSRVEYVGAIDLISYGGLKPRLDDDIRRDAVAL